MAQTSPTRRISRHFLLPGALLCVATVWAAGGLLAAESHVTIRYRPAEAVPASSPHVLAQGRAVATATHALAPVDINTATAEELQAGLVGVGPAKAAAILAWRAEHGGFGRAEDLLDVKGIGPALLEKNRLRLRVTSPPVISSPTSAEARVSESRKSLQKHTGIPLN